MADYYDKKTAVFQKIEDTIKLERGGYVVEASLVQAVERATGFTIVVRRHIQNLVDKGLVQRTEVDGKTTLKWVNPDVVV